MIQILDKYGNTSTDDGRVIILDKFGDIKKPAVSSGTVTSILTASPITGGLITTTGTIGITQATTSTDGYLSSTDWTAFNSKFNLPSLTSGSVLFSNGTTIAQDNANFFWDNTNKRLGIGTASPTTLLDIQPASGTPVLRVARTGGTDLRMGASTTSIGAVVGTYTDSPLNFYTNSLTKVTINSSGDLLVGTGTSAFSSPGRGILQVNGAVNSILALTNNNVRAGYLYHNGSDLSVWNEVSGALIFGTNNVEGMRMLSSNRYIGIGTTAPTARLQVTAPGALSTDIALKVRNSANTADLLNVLGNGNVGIGTTTPGIKLQVETSVNGSDGIWGRNTNTGTSAYGYVVAASGVGAVGFRAHSAAHGAWPNTSMIHSASPFTNGMVIYQAGASPIALWTNDVERMRITSSGNVGIGTTSPAAKLHTVGDGLFSSNTNTNLTINSNGGVSILTLTTSAGTQSIYGGVGGLNNMDFYTASGFRMRIDPTGNVGIGTTAPLARLEVRAQGALSTDIALKVRNSADTADLMTVNGVGQLGIDRNFGLKFFLSSVISAPSNGSILLTDAAGTSFGRFQFGGTSNLFPSIKRNTTNLEFKLADDSAFTGIISATSLVGGTSLNSSAILQADSTTKGFLPPRMTNAQRLAIATPAVGLCVYCTDAVEGLYINKSTGWTYIG